MNRKAVIRLVVAMVAVYAVVIAAQLLIALLTNPQEADAKELIARRLADIERLWTHFFSILVAALAAAFLKWTGALTLDQRAADDTMAESPLPPAPMDRGSASRVMFVRSPEAEAQAKLDQARRQLKEWSAHVRDLRRRLADAGRFRAILILLCLFAIANPISIIIESGWKLLDRRFEISAAWPFGHPLMYLQTLLLAAAAGGLSFWVYRGYQRRTHNTDSSAAVMIGLMGIGGAGFLALAQTTPAMFQAMSPEGWNVPLFGQWVPLFYFLVLTRLVLFPALGVGGAMVAHWRGVARNHNADADDAEAAGESDPESKPVIGPERGMIRPGAEDGRTEALPPVVVTRGTRPAERAAGPEVADARVSQ